MPLLSVSAGAGHLRAAEAVEKAFLQMSAAGDIVARLLALQP